MTVELTQQDVQIILGCLDATLKSSGVQALKDAHRILTLLEKASEATTTKEEN